MGFLVFTRKNGQSFRIGEATVYVNSEGVNRVRVVIDAPREIEIRRSELGERKDREAA